MPISHAEMTNADTTMSPPPRAYPTAQAAALLGVSVRQMYRLLAEDRIRAVRLGRHMRIPESELRRFLDVGREG